MEVWSLKRYRLAHKQLAKITVVLVLVAAVLFVSVPIAVAAPDKPSVEWSTTFDRLQATSVIQPSIGGYAIAGKSSAFGGDTLIKVDESGTVQWKQPHGNLVSLAEIGSGYILFGENGDVITTDINGNTQSSFSIGLAGVVDAVSCD